MKEELKPCPFCGGIESLDVREVHLHNRYCADEDIYNIECRKCLFCTSNFDSKEELYLFWNTRPAEDEMYQMLKYLADGVRWGGIQHTDRSLALKIENLLRKARGEEMNICYFCIHKQTCTNKPLATTKCKDFEDNQKMTKEVTE